MKRIVHKYEVRCCNQWKEIVLPEGAKILSAICKQLTQRGDGILIYAEIDPGQTAFDIYKFLAIGTGREFNLEKNMVFLNTVQIPAPINEVYHVYYVCETDKLGN